MVVLDGDVLDALARERVRGGEVVGMQIVRDHARLDREQPLEVGDPLLERGQRLGVLEVADVVADPGAAPAGEAERALELGAAREHVPACRDRQREHAGDRAAGAPQRQRASARGPQHRVVGARLDRAVVAEHEVGDRPEPLERVIVAIGDRLVGHVATRHHQRLADVAQQQVVERAVRQHHAELGRARRNGPRDARAPPARRDHDRPVAPAQQRRLGRPEDDQLAGGPHVGRHQCERLLLAVLASTQPPDRLLVRRHAREMEAADALDRHDRTGTKGGHDTRKGV